MDVLIVMGAKYLFVAAPLLVVFVMAVLPPSRRPLLTRGVMALALAIALAKGGGTLYNEPRPFVVRHVAPLIPHEADNGFPSDHTLLCAACAFLILPFSRPLGMAAAGVALLVGAARIAALIHSPLDILASFVFAAIAVYAATYFEQNYIASRETN